MSVLLHIGYKFRCKDLHPYTTVNMMQINNNSWGKLRKEWAATLL